MKNRVKLGLLLPLALCAGLVHAQEAGDKIEALLAVERVSYAQAAGFVLEAADVASLSDPAEAFQYAADQGWLPKKASPNETARLDGIALLLMRAFNLKGGLLYTVAKNAHYAYRDMVYQNVIRNRADPSMAVSGDYLLFMIGNVMTLTETGNDPGTEG